MFGVLGSKASSLSGERKQRERVQFAKRERRGRGISLAFFNLFLLSREQITETLSLFLHTLFFSGFDHKERDASG